jgi:subtilisin family serine protease
VTVAVVDTGVAPHVDYGSNLLAGYNFWARSTDTVDTSGHGTLIAGIIAAARGNGGFVGVAPQAHILPVKVMGGRDAEFADRPAVEGIKYAIRKGADVLNLSWGGYDGIGGIGAALRAAAAARRVVVVAAGNDAIDLDSATFGDRWNPDTAGYTNAITVAATDDLDHLAHYSNFGRWHVQIAAPGSGIQGDYLDNWWSGGFGTSYAAPQVAGVAALLYADYPDATASQIVRAIIVGGRRLPQLRGKVACGCLLSAPGALAAMAVPDTLPPSPFNEHGPPSSFTLQEPRDVTFRWDRSSDVELDGYRLRIDGAVHAFPPSRHLATVRLGAGIHSWSVSAYDLSGNVAQAR